MLWRKKKDNVAVKTIITKTSTQAQYERDIRKQVNLQSNTCPECGYYDYRNSATFPMRLGDTNIKVIHSECCKCGAEWDVQYEI